MYCQLVFAAALRKECVNRNCDKRTGNITFEECEVIEKLKTFQPATRFPQYYYGCYFPKSELNQLAASTYTLRYVSDRRCDEEAAEAMEKHFEEREKQLQRSIDECRKASKNIKDWRKKKIR